MTAPRHFVTAELDDLARGIWQAGMPWRLAMEAALIIRDDARRTEYENQHTTEETCEP